MNKSAIIESLLFASGDDGISIKQISEVLDIDKEETEELINNLISYYESDNRGIKISLYNDKYIFVTKSKYSSYYKKLFKTNDSTSLSQAALEVLAIIAYNEPYTRVQIDEIRGVNSSHIIRRLISMNLICECGKSNLPGKPTMYKTTDYFLKYFGISNLSMLPPIKEVEVDDEEIDLFNSTEVRRDENLEVIE